MSEFLDLVSFIVLSVACGLYVECSGSLLGWQICDPSKRALCQFFTPLSRIEPNEGAAWLDAASRLEAQEKR